MRWPRVVHVTYISTAPAHSSLQRLSNVSVPPAGAVEEAHRLERGGPASGLSSAQLSEPVAAAEPSPVVVFSHSPISLLSRDRRSVHEASAGRAGQRCTDARDASLAAAAHEPSIDVVANPQAPAAPCCSPRTLAFSIPTPLALPSPYADPASTLQQRVASQPRDELLRQRMTAPPSMSTFPVLPAALLRLRSDQQEECKDADTPGGSVRPCGLCGICRGVSSIACPVPGSRSESMTDPREGKLVIDYKTRAHLSVSAFANAATFNSSIVGSGDLLYSRRTTRSSVAGSVPLATFSSHGAALLAPTAAATLAGRGRRGASRIAPLSATASVALPAASASAAAVAGATAPPGSLPPSSPVLTASATLRARIDALPPYHDSFEALLAAAESGKPCQEALAAVGGRRTLARYLTAAGFRYTTLPKERTAHDDFMNALAPLLLSVDGARFDTSVLSKFAKGLLGKSSRAKVTDAVTGDTSNLTTYAVTRHINDGTSTQAVLHWQCR